MTSVAKRLHKIHVSRTSGSLHVPAVACGNVCLLCFLFFSRNGRLSAGEPTEPFVL